MKYSIISAVAALASFAAATPIVTPLDSTLSSFDSTLKVFSLVAGPDAPADIAGATLQISSKDGGGLGWYPAGGSVTTAVPATLFIQNNAKDGIAFYSKNTVYEAFLRPTHGTPLYLVNIGNPLLDAAPALTFSEHFTLDTVNGLDYFGYNHGTTFTACGSAGSYALYLTGSRDGCISVSLIAKYE